MNNFYDLKIDLQRQVAAFVFSGRMTAGTWRWALLDYVAEREFDPAHALIWDIRGAEVVTDFAGIFGAVQSLRAAFSRFPQEVLAVILVQGGFQYGMARMLQQILEFAAPIRLVIVETGDEACAHLALQVEDLPNLLQTSAPG